MNARGTRRPHPRRVRSKPVKTSRRSGGGGSKSGCPLTMLAFFAILSLPATALWLVTR